jgi:hypothetical protein
MDKYFKIEEYQPSEREIKRSCGIQNCKRSPKWALYFKDTNAIKEFQIWITYMCNDCKQCHNNKP